MAKTPVFTTAELADEVLADSICAAARRLGISRSLTYIEIASGRLKAVKAGRRTLVPRVSQEAWLNSLPAA